MTKKQFIDTAYIKLGNKKNVHNRRRKYKEEYHLLENNKYFKNKYRDKRCFILGNGPSLYSFEWALLKDEYTFTVNMLPKNRDFPKLRSNFHIWTDPIFFDTNIEDPYENSIIQSFKRLSKKEQQCTCFLPIHALGFVKKYQLDRNQKINYIDNCLKWPDGFSGDIDLTKAIFDCSTVVIQAIEIAIYMGFSEIFLLGCDCTGILGQVNAQLEQDITTYAYELSEQDRDRIRSTNQMHSMEGIFLQWVNVFHYYKELSWYCEKKDILLRNCTSGGILDSIPRRKLMDVLNNEY